jgi:alcohol dehydrogenase (cytochrome c)
VTGSYDPDLNLTYWGTGNVGPDYSHEQRPGDNLYTAAVVALDADTGRPRWHYQFTPHDRYDYDAVQVPVLADITLKGAPLKAMLWHRNGNLCARPRDGKFRWANRSSVSLMSGPDANAADPDPSTCGHADVSGDTGRDELVFPVL